MRESSGPLKNTRTKREAQAIVGTLLTSMTNCMEDYLLSPDAWHCDFGHAKEGGPRSVDVTRNMLSGMVKRIREGREKIIEDVARALQKSRRRTS